MKTRPILFKGEMVRAILAGRKTQTRRIVKPQPIPFQPNYPHPEAECLAAIGKPWMPVGGVNVERWKCPHGSIGDRLWVRETFQTGEYAQNEPRGAVYRATNPDWQTQEGWKWKPSLFMPRSLSRITLEITGVRCERLQNISEADAKAEGCDGNCPVGYIPAHQKSPCVYRYAQLWESINGAGSWSENPWVWVIEFKKL